ncbi:MarR family winged helix-turn-helix transcriptional regulator [Terasakiella pusilla]|uniref:MarR family winged helix-turn-helix transcriptional regulator n=1 Tax=Terasakiella pusilla TaxID=64973 RepID=UPI003AA881AF
MVTLEQKYCALLGVAQEKGQADLSKMKACFEVLALASAIDRACARRLAPYQLSEGKFIVLFLLQQMPQGGAPNELAERAGVTRGTITGLLDGLERDGYISRQQDAADRRRLIVRLSPQGEEVAAKLGEEHSRWIVSLFEGFSEEDFKVLSPLLNRVWKTLEEDDVI